MRASIFIATTAAIIGSVVADKCQNSYKNCIALGNPEVYCDCQLATCTGEDSARERDYCSTATAGMTIKTGSATASAAASATPYVDKCQKAYNQCKAWGNTDDYCSCNLATCSGEDSARERDYCSTATAGYVAKTGSASSTVSVAATPYPVVTGKNGTAAVTSPAAGAANGGVKTITTSCTTSTGAAGATGTAGKTGATSTHSVVAYTGAANAAGLSAGLAAVAGVFAFLA
ncbi:hypothetical protein K461DRAFT_282891 [Myriangium duriaei CBS 260.36]|uniref:Extracellular membrane protein CFEM domain-containing protein n=1 Tax=Myriangium duriaei CBS 260.36 TaxID=1168546 RepID=A0A9P4IVB9_9PEZI|nr:hypothetical protein K461DRAFT_282891 [Myriangium duriaei CBS 260.36]